MPVPIMTASELQGLKSYNITKVEALCTRTANLLSLVGEDGGEGNLCHCVTLVAFLTSSSPIHFPHHNINATQNYHDVSDGVSETKVFQDS